MEILLTLLLLPRLRLGLERATREGRLHRLLASVVRRLVAGRLLVQRPFGGRLAVWLWLCSKLLHPPGAGREKNAIGRELSFGFTRADIPAHAGSECDCKRMYLVNVHGLLLLSTPCVSAMRRAITVGGKVFAFVHMSSTFKVFSYT